MRDSLALILRHVPLSRVPLIPEIRLHIATATTHVAWLPAEPAPYWAYVWPGGGALARHVLDQPQTVRGRHVLDLGAGSGLVGIAAAMAGAASVTASEIDEVGRTAIGLNAGTNRVAIAVCADDLLPGPPPAGIDLVLVGDLLYTRELAEAVVPFLLRCREAGIEVMLGDPGRGFLPRTRIRYVAEYGAGSVDDDRDAPTTPAAVYALE